MKRRSMLWIAAGLFVALCILTGSQLVSARPPAEADTPEVALGQPGLSYRYVKTFGTLGVPYFSDLVHINRPLGLFIDESNNLFVTEEQGQRLLKFNATGMGQFSIGKAGVCITDDYGFCGVNDAVTDSGGNIWVADGNRVAQFSSTGGFLQQFPTVDPWMSGSDNTRFNGANGVALDTSGRLYVSDRYNHRIQVFDLSGGTPVYSTTIGMAGVSGSGADQFNEPYRIAIDSNDRLIVPDRMNNRVQICSYSGSWTCNTLDSSLNRPQGVAVANNNDVFIADTENGRIRKCTSGGVCSDFVTFANWFYDVAVDSSGRVYGAAAYEDIVIRFSSTGTQLGTFVGIEFVPYLTDGYHYFKPRIAIDHADNIIILEENGHRLVKLDPNGILLWTYGVPGVDMWGVNDHFNYPHSVAVDLNNNIYVADGCRVQIFSPTGSYQSTLGGPDCGTGNYQFNWATGVDVDNNGNIYVVDYSNQRVMIYNSSKTFIGQIGVTGECTTANDRLCSPIAVDTDTAGNIYVTDSGNARVQKFNSSRVWQMTIGTGVGGDQFDQFSWAEDIAVDAQGKIFVTDWSNNRVQVYDSTGKYLTTIAGSWGMNPSQLTGAPGVDVDSKGNVYVADWENDRIQVFAPGIPGWQQVNLNGFGDRNDQAAALETFNGQLYAGTDNWIDNFDIYRTSDGQTWEQARNFPFTGGVLDMTVFNGQLYASTGWGADNSAARILRTSNGTTWEEVATAGFGVDDNRAMDTLAVFQNKIYISVSNSAGDSGSVSIYRSDSGNSGTWMPVVTGGKGDINNHLIPAMAEFNGFLYAGVQNKVAGTRIWRTSDGITWNQVNTDGFGEANNYETITLAVFKGQLYAGTINNVTGGQIWRTSNGTTWTPVMTNGFGDPSNFMMLGLYAFQNRLYATASNDKTGTEVWSSPDGNQWIQMNIDGWGDSNNGFSLRGNALANFKD